MTGPTPVMSAYLFSLPTYCSFFFFFFFVFDCSVLLVGEYWQRTCGHVWCLLPALTKCSLACQRCHLHHDVFKIVRDKMAKTGYTTDPVANFQNAWWCTCIRLKSFFLDNWLPFSCAFCRKEKWTAVMCRPIVLYMWNQKVWCSATAEDCKILEPEIDAPCSVKLVIILWIP